MRGTRRALLRGLGGLSVGALSGCTLLDEVAGATDGVREVADEQNVRDRLSIRVADADREVYLVVAEEALLEPADLDPAAVTDRDVAVYAEVPSEAARERLHEAVPASRAAVSELGAGTPAEDHQPGRLALFDRETALLSALQGGSSRSGGPRPASGEPASDTGWSSGSGRSTSGVVDDSRSAPPDAGDTGSGAVGRRRHSASGSKISTAPE